MATKNRPWTKHDQVGRQKSSNTLGQLKKNRREKGLLHHVIQSHTDLDEIQIRGYFVVNEVAGVTSPMIRVSPLNTGSSHASQLIKNVMWVPESVICALRGQNPT